MDLLSSLWIPYLFSAKAEAKRALRRAVRVRRHIVNRTHDRRSCSWCQGNLHHSERKRIQAAMSDLS